MAKIKENIPGSGRWYFQCPGCKDIQCFTAPPWKIEGGVDNPTVNPSILFRSGHFVDGDKSSCWCARNLEEQGVEVSSDGFNCVQCHSFIKNGNIEFLSDCSHDLKGQTVELPEWESA